MRLMPAAGDRQVHLREERFAMVQRAALLLMVWLTVAMTGSVSPAQELPLKIDGTRAFRYLEQICRLGPRVSGSDGMQKQQQLIIQHFQQFGCQISAQSFDAPHPLSGQPVRMTNLVVSWQPAAKERVLLCCHYDTRPYPDQDTFRPRGTFIGANDGASGVALFMEMAHHLKTITPRYGVDMVFFDGEELVYSRNDPYFLGSEYFANWYASEPPAYRYVCGVLVDMIADKKLSLGMEKNSVQMAPEVTRSVWAVAQQLRVTEFVPKVKYEVRDDHLALNQIARIPTCDIIDFEYPQWHTTRDTPSACSGDSLAKVARVLLAWLQTVPIEAR